MATPHIEPDGNDAAGWDAITAACEAVYPRQTDPPHFAPTAPPDESPDQVRGLSAYQATHPVRHWHLVTYGFSELGGKEWGFPQESGWGFELTVRPARDPADGCPPVWALNLLFNTGRYVKRTSNPFVEGCTIDLNGTIAPGEDTNIRAVAFVADPQLGVLRTPNGVLRFVQMVGLTLDEYHACEDWRPEKVLSLLRANNPLLVTDLNRRSILADPSVARQVQAGIAAEGAAADWSFLPAIDWRRSGKKANLVVGSRGVQAVRRKLRARLLHGRPHTFLGATRRIRFEPANTNGWVSDRDLLIVYLTEPMVRALLDTVQPTRGLHLWPELRNFALHVHPPALSDFAGQAVEVIG
jgi:hypothetical protein